MGYVVEGIAVVILGKHIHSCTVPNLFKQLRQFGFSQVDIVLCGSKVAADIGGIAVLVADYGNDHPEFAQAYDNAVGSLIQRTNGILALKTGQINTDLHS